MANINIRCDDSVITLLERLQHAGFGKTKTDTVLAALDLLSESTLLDLARARMAKLERAEEVRKVVAVVVAPVAAVEPVVVAAPVCEICAGPLDGDSTRFCMAHLPEVD